MKAELISEDQMVDGDEVTFWTIKNGETEVCLNDLFDSNVYDCEWLDEEHHFCRLEYSEWDSSDLMAIVNSHGQIMRKGIYSIEEYVNDDLMIVIITGFGLGEQSAYYMMEEDDRKCAVIDMCGDFILEPEYENIEFDDEEEIFIADDYKYNLNGKRIN